MLDDDVNNDGGEHLDKDDLFVPFWFVTVTTLPHGNPAMPHTFTTCQMMMIIMMTIMTTTTMTTNWPRQKRSARFTRVTMMMVMVTVMTMMN